MVWLQMVMFQPPDKFSFFFVSTNKAGDVKNIPHIYCLMLMVSCGSSSTISTGVTLADAEALYGSFPAVYVARNTLEG